MSRHDYLPFGEEVYAGSGSRTTQNGYVGDNINQKFTLKERDNETGLDFFEARYYASAQGRFTSADSYGGQRFNPQSLNSYTYVMNNPLRFVDPSGHQGEGVKKKGKRGTYDEDFGNTYDTPQIVVIDAVPANATSSQTQTQTQTSRDPIEDIIPLTDAGTFGRTLTGMPSSGTSLGHLRSQTEAMVRRVLDDFTRGLPPVPDGVQVNGCALFMLCGGGTVTQDLDVFVHIDTGGWAEALRAGWVSRTLGKLGTPVR